jgi:predicted nucleotidyltransferase component of viral defense system
VVLGRTHTRSPLRDRLAFKGGTALKKCYFGDYRFSEDLDFTLIAETSWEEIEGPTRDRSPERAGRPSRLI